MNTEKRLNEAYKKAEVYKFNKDSKYFIISDCHRGTGSPSDEFSKNRNTYIHALRQYFQNGFTYIEAGDGDELLEHKKADTIIKAHYTEYEMIKKFHDNNRYIMIYGNHNIYMKNPKYVQKYFNQFYDEYKQSTNTLFENFQPVESLILKHIDSEKEILIVHGHQGDFSNDQGWTISAITIKFFWRFLHMIGAKSPTSPSKSAHKRHKIEKNFSKWLEKNNTALICGHTHRYKFPKENELPYFNTGCCIYPTSMTAIEIENDEICIVSWRIVANEEGVLQVKRKILRGPEPILNYI